MLTLSKIIKTVNLAVTKYKIKLILFLQCQRTITNWLQQLFIWFIINQSRGCIQGGGLRVGGIRGGGISGGGIQGGVIQGGEGIFPNSSVINAYSLDFKIVL